jgi:hypothetical protein
VNLLCLEEHVTAVLNQILLPTYFQLKKIFVVRDRRQDKPIRFTELKVYYTLPCFIGQVAFSLGEYIYIYIYIWNFHAYFSRQGSKSTRDALLN